MAETIGQQLKFARLAQSLSIEEVVEATRIRPNYIEALEADDFDAFPSAAQGRGFLHNYAGFLGLNMDDILARQRETPAPAPDQIPAPTEEPAPATPEPVAAAEEPAAFSWTEPLPSTEIVRPPESLLSTPEPAPAAGLPRWDEIPAPEPAPVKKKPARRAPPPKASKPATKPVKKETKKAAAAKPSVKKAATAKTAAAKPAAKPVQEKTKKATGKPLAISSPKGKKTAPPKTTAVNPAVKKGAEKKPAAPASAKNKKAPAAKTAAKKSQKPEARKPSAAAKPAVRKKSAKKDVAEATIEFETPPPPFPVFEPLPEITTIPEPETLKPIGISEETLEHIEPLPEIEPEPESEIVSEPEPEVPEAVTKPAESSKEIFTSIGKELAERRELLGMTLDEIERHTHVRKHYLEFIESGQFDQLPSSVQTRGMINNYAHFLDMDADALLLRFADGLQVQRQERHPSGGTPGKPARRGKVSRGIRRYLSVDMFIGGGLIVLLVLFAIWGTNQIISMRSTPTAEATAPSISNMLQVSPTAGNALPTDTPVEGPAVLPTSDGQTEVAAALPTGSAGDIQVIVVALERAYVVVTVDGAVKFDGRVVPGTAYPFDAKKQVEVLTGNGAAIKIIYNGADLGVMGTFGQVVDLIYTSGAVITPTSTSTPTATASPIPTATPIPSATPKPSATPRLTSTSTP